MGWYYGPERNAREVRDLILREKAENGRKVLDHAMTGAGHRLWLAVEDPSNFDERWVELYLLQGVRDGWGYKPMSEHSGPYYYDCPLRILDATGIAAEADASGYAHEWRVKVREYHAQNRAGRSLAKTLSPGQTIAYTDAPGKVFTFKERRHRLYVAYGPDGRLYRLSPAKMRPA